MFFKSKNNVIIRLLYTKPLAIEDYLRAISGLMSTKCLKKEHYEILWALLCLWLHLSMHFNLFFFSALPHFLVFVNSYTFRKKYQCSTTDLICINNQSLRHAQLQTSQGLEAKDIQFWLRSRFVSHSDALYNGLP